MLTQILPSVHVQLRVPLHDFTPHHAVIGPYNFIYFHGVISLLVAQNLIIALQVLHAPRQLNVVLHSLAEALITFVGEHYFLCVSILVLNDPLVLNADIVEVQDSALGRLIAPNDVVSLEVDHDT